MSLQENPTETDKTEKSKTMSLQSKRDNLKTKESYQPSSVDPLRNEMNLKHYVNDFNGFARKKQRTRYNEKRKNNYLHSLSPEVIQFKSQRDLRYILYSLKRPKGSNETQDELYNKISKMKKIELINEIARFLRENIQLDLLKWKKIIDTTE